ncbi:hypothetical protein [Kutzneria buriramensis]|uniref:Uncharacterized protein n=1 Tax=Kutzneria buriramensis TaxID=1045776 RepID=A0A3E0I007_9PSEU|nr:hypothetical protein [Kutzneria buriramensis]REH51971.1 hypothetical protein BCF44_103420 [Kutzneria buriramensis]
MSDAAARLRELISHYDRLLMGQDEIVTPERVELARMTAAAGRLLFRHKGWDDSHPVARTLAAADAFVAGPSDDTYSEYVRVATNSYPFGAGDGCFKLPGYDSCEPGSGCTTGAGSLWSIASVIGHETTLIVMS